MKRMLSAVGLFILGVVGRVTIMLIWITILLFYTALAFFYAIFGFAASDRNRPV